MLGIQAHAARVAWTIFLLALLAVTVFLIRRTLLIFILALFFAYMLTPLVNLVDRITPTRMPRSLALAIVYILLLGILVAVGFTLGSKLAEETAVLAKRLPGMMQPAQLEKIWLPAWLEPARGRIIGAIGSLQNSSGQILPALRGVGERLIALAGNLGFAVLVPILAFFFLKDAATLRATLLNLMDHGPRRRLVEEILDDVHILLAQYIRALVLLSLATFLIYSIFFGIVGVPYAVLLASVAAMFEFIPVLGPISAVLIVTVVAAASGFNSILMLLIFFGVYRLFQDYILQPWLMSAGVELHPLIVIFGALAGEQVGGVAGMFLSVPVLATLRVVYVRASRSRALRPSTIETA